jgi:hypothetical protein
LLTRQVLDNGGRFAAAAYGASGTGKTYTMLGNEVDEGIVYMILKHLWLRDYGTIELAIIEIYQNSMKDLINNEKITFASVDKGRFKGLKEVEITSAEQAFGIVRATAGKRQQGVTGLNNASSRSHLMIRIRAVRRDKASEPCDILLTDLGILH